MSFYRIDKDEYGLEIAKTVARRGECSRRQVGAVICNEKGRILSTGFNGVAPGADKCRQGTCPGFHAASGTNLDGCRASHAEISALVYLPSPDEAFTLYCTSEPCFSCTKAILLTNIQRVVFAERYAATGIALWNRQYWGTLDENLVQA